MDIFSKATEIATPLGLAGLGLTILFYLLRQILRNNITRLGRTDSREMTFLIVNRLFILGVVVTIIGCAGWFWIQPPPSEKKFNGQIFLIDKITNVRHAKEGIRVKSGKIMDEQTLSNGYFSGSFFTNQIKGANKISFTLSYSDDHEKGDSIITLPIDSIDWENLEFNIFTIKRDKKGSSTTNPIQIVELAEQDLGHAADAQKVGPGDEELAGWENTHLTGSFKLIIRQGSTKIVGELEAKIKQEALDNTTFRVSKSYQIYTAPIGYRIEKFEVDVTNENETEFDFFQKAWHTTEILNSGPLSQLLWQGDSGKKQDQIDGCWLEPRLRKLKISIRKV
jgi:hypothetical protein